MSEVIQTNSPRAWLLAIRPKTLGAMCCPILIGTAFAIADQHFSPALFVITFLCSILLQILSNIVNDFGDYCKGNDTNERLGPPRAMQMGFVSHTAMKRAIVLVTLLVLVLGIFLVARGGMVILSAGVVAIGLCFWYTIGTIPLSHLGFSEVVIFVVFGPAAVLGSYFIQTLSFSYPAMIASMSSGFLCAALLLTNNLRDYQLDKKNGKYTLAVRIGLAWSRYLIIFLVLSAALGPLLLWLRFDFGGVVLLSNAALFIPLRYTAMILHQPVSSRFNVMLAAVGKCLYVFGVLFFLGVIYGAP